jgi:quercetin dioxygenase-like cupin family protein
MADEIPSRYGDSCGPKAADQQIGGKMIRKVWLLLCSLIMASSANSAPNHESSSGFVHLQAVDVPYEASPDKPGLRYAVLSGNPSEAGIYVLRLKIPPGLIFPPHHHDQDRHVTVISGVWAFGTGYSGKCEDAIPLTAGAYVMHPKGAVHFDGACGEESVEVQIIGRGPVKTTWIEGAE